MPIAHSPATGEAPRSKREQAVKRITISQAAADAEETRGCRRHTVAGRYNGVAASGTSDNTANSGNAADRALMSASSRNHETADLPCRILPEFSRHVRLPNALLGCQTVHVRDELPMFPGLLSMTARRGRGRESKLTVRASFGADRESSPASSTNLRRCCQCSWTLSAR